MYGEDHQKDFARYFKRARRLFWLGFSLQVVVYSAVIFVAVHFIRKIW